MSEQQTPSGFPVYVAGSTDSKRAVIVIQEAFGVNGHIRSVADRFGEAGYFAVAPHLFHRDGSPEIAYDDFPSAMKYMANLNQDGLTNDLRATTDFLSTLGYDASNIGIVGYCMGGTVSFYAATTSSVGAAASFYGGGVTAGRFGLAPLVELAKDLKCPWLGLYGDLDAGIPVEQVEALRDATSATSVFTDIVRYADADHGFHCDGRANVYNESAARDAHQRTLEFFTTYLTER
ncbi:MAG: dienelactone hydrolase family protein [Acidimicrobiaceae bacterium]|nr:dienelactone hydrolase family protein [Acidimicrobiaceae bacterium]